MVQIKRQLASQNVINQRSYGRGNPVNSITIHQTGNTNKGANAQAHANLQSNLNPRQASWHYQVDDKEIIQSFEDDVQCWAATDGRGPGNTTSVHIEICINEDGDYKKAVENGAALTKHLMDKYNLGINMVKQHFNWSPKNCPAQLRAGYKGVAWNDFIKMVTGSGSVKSDNKEVHIVQKGDTLSGIAEEYNTTVDALVKLNGIKDKNVIRHGQEIKLVGTSSNAPKTNTPKGNMQTNSIVEYLNSIGVDSSFANRKKLALQHGISNYTGTASQNLGLLNAARKGSSSKATSAPKGGLQTNSVVDYLKSIKVESSFANRKKLASQHGISNYTGTASQNAQLLKKLRG